MLHACCTGVGNGSACTMHVVRVLSNMHVGSACNMHVACMLYECWSNKHVGVTSMLVAHVTCIACCMRGVIQ